MIPPPDNSPHRYRLDYTSHGYAAHHTCDTLQEATAYLRRHIGKQAKIYDRTTNQRGTLYLSGSVRWNRRTR